MLIGNINFTTFFHLVNSDHLISSKEAVLLLDRVGDDVFLKHDIKDTILLAMDVKVQNKTYSFYVVSKSNMFNLSRVCVFDCHGKQVKIDKFAMDSRGFYQLVNIKQFLIDYDYQAIIDNSLTGKTIEFALNQTNEMALYLQEEFSI